MRKLKLQVQMTIDGFIGGPNGEMDFMVHDWDQPLIDYVTGIMQGVDTILLGRNLAEGFIPHWTGALNDPAQADSARFFVDTPKIVFSRELTETKWANTQVNNGDLADEVRALKAQPGQDMICYGGSAFVSSLIKEKLIDELHLFVNPTILGKGLPIFQDVTEKHSMKLITAIPTSGGITVLAYGLAG